MKWLVVYSRLPYPPVEYNVRYPNYPATDQPLEITVIADTEEEAIVAANAQVNYQIKNGRVTTSKSHLNSNSVKTGSPRVYTLVKVLRLKK
jgi:hypothetical protein